MELTSRSRLVSPQPIRSSHFPKSLMHAESALFYRFTSNWQGSILSIRIQWLGVVGFGGLVTSQPHATNIVCISEAVFVLFFIEQTHPIRRIS
jgi:hypothetical protein